MRKTWDWGSGKELLFMYVMYKNVIYLQITYIRKSSLCASTTFEYLFPCTCITFLKTTSM